MLAVVGAGRMGGAMLRGWREAGRAAGELLVIDPNPGEDAQRVVADGAPTDPTRLPEADTVLLSVKPQAFSEVAPTLDLAPDATVVSIMAGTSVKTLQTSFPGRDVLRAMPNTPASIGMGVTGLYGAQGVDAETVLRVQNLLRVCGPVVVVETESDIDRVTAVSGSGPAYVFHMVEALQAAGEALGLSMDYAKVLARETVRGAAALLETGEADALRRAVTSPNGTTQAALDVLMPELPALMARTTRAAFERAKELGS